MKNFIYLFTVVFALSLFSCSDDDDAQPAAITVTTDEVSTLGASISFTEVEGALYYDIEISEDGGEFEYIESLYDVNSYELEDLKAGTAYQVKVKANSNKVIGEGTVNLTTVSAVSELVGSWKYTYNTLEIIYTFNADGTGEYTYDSNTKLIKWHADQAVVSEESDLTIITFATDYNGTSTSETVKYTYYGEDESITIDGTIYSPVTE